VFDVSGIREDSLIIFLAFFQGLDIVVFPIGLGDHQSETQSMSDGFAFFVFLLTKRRKIWPTILVNRS
jgi:hypothetical protein